MLSGMQRRMLEERGLKRGHSDVAQSYMSTREEIDQFLPESSITWKDIPIEPSNEVIKFPVLNLDAADRIFSYSIENNLPEAFGVVLWNSSYRMINEIKDLSTKQDKGLQGLSICDLGCGTGLLSLVAYSLGASKVIGLDFNAFSLRIAEMSFERNRNFLWSNRPLSQTVVFQRFDLEDMDNPVPPCDILLISDMLYTASLAKAVAKRTFDAITDCNHDITVYITDPLRSTTRVFLLELEKLYKDHVKQGQSLVYWDEKSLKIFQTFYHEYQDMKKLGISHLFVVNRSLIEFR